MTLEPTLYDALIVGGGFYGCALALHLRRRGLERILLVEQESELIQRASYTNQARVHQGYHYPRSFVTAYRSRVNFKRFAQDFSFAVKSDFTKLYAVARRHSRVTANQFEHFMRDIEAPFERAGPELRRLFNPRLVEAVYVTQEFAFDAAALRRHFVSELHAANVFTWTRARMQHIHRSVKGGLEAEIMHEGTAFPVRASWVLNCTYARLNRVMVGTARALTPLKHEVTELALVEPPPSLRTLGITLMDGPFFSCMPFPAAGCHSLSHVRYTPHGSFVDADGQRDPGQELAENPPSSRVHFMLASASQYVPALSECTVRRSMFEVKTTLVRNELDDGRPILLRRDALHPQMLSVLGGKIDNIYDITKQLDEVLVRH